MHPEPQAVASPATHGSNDVQKAVHFEACRDDASGLCFRSYLPDPAPARPRARLALLHGYGDHGGRYGHALNWFAERGISCCTLDFRGHGRSFGRRGYVRRWDEFLDDLDTFLAWERSRNA